jgi:hypothetical protein
MILKKVIGWICLFALMLMAFAFSALALPTPDPSGLPVLDTVSGAILGINGGIVAALTVALGFVFRLMKTDRPLSIVWLVVGFIRMAARILCQVSNVLAAVAGLFDKVLPQNSVQPAVMSVSVAEPAKPKA